MATPNSRHELIRVKGPALPPVLLVSEANPKAPPSELIRVKGPALPSVSLTSEPVALAATVCLTFPLAAGDDGARLFERLHALVTKVNEIEALIGSTGVWVDVKLSGVHDGEVVVVLASTDPTDGVDTCKRVADILFAASRKVPRVRVFRADQPETPVYELPLAI